MTYKIQIDRKARKELEKLPKAEVERIKAKISRLEHDSRPQDATKLRGYDTLYQLRVGSYRIVYEIVDDILIILVLAIAHRKHVYQKLAL